MLLKMAVGSHGILLLVVLQCFHGCTRAQILLDPGRGQQECTYTLMVPASQIEASCGGPRLMQEVEELRRSNEDLKATTEEMKNQMLFLIKKYEGLEEAMKTIQKDTASWRQIVEWPSYDPTFDLEDGEVDFIAEGKEFQDCFQALKKTRSGKEGIYSIKPNKAPRAFLTYCDADGWLIILRRLDGTIDFDKNWSDYSGGFGELTGEYWLGLEHLHQLTGRNRKFELQMEGVGYNNKLYTAAYDNFSVKGEMENYYLSVNNMSDGNIIPDEMAALSGFMFTTRDRDNDAWSRGNCAAHYAGGWWQDNCGFGPTRRYCNGPSCMGWGKTTLKKIVLKLRPMSAKGTVLKKPQNKRKLRGGD